MWSFLLVRQQGSINLTCQQEDALVDGSDRAQGAWVSLQIQCGFPCRKLLERGELEGHLHRKYHGGESQRFGADYVKSITMSFLN